MQDTLTLKIVDINGTKSGFMSHLKSLSVKNGAIMTVSNRDYDRDIECHVWHTVEVDGHIIHTKSVPGIFACITEYMIINGDNGDCRYPCFKAI